MGQCSSFEPRPHRTFTGERTKAKLASAETVRRPQRPSRARESSPSRAREPSPSLESRCYPARSNCVRTYASATTLPHCSASSPRLRSRRTPQKTHHPSHGFRSAPIVQVCRIRIQVSDCRNSALATQGARDRSMGASHSQRSAHASTRQRM
jgi:hypothetical protein